MHAARVAALPYLDSKVDRFAIVIESSRIPEVAARDAEVAEGPRGAWEAELVGQRERLLCVMHRGLAPSPESLGAGELGERAHELWAGRERFEQRHRVGRQVGPARVAETEEHVGERAHRPCGSTNVARRLEGADRLLECVSRLGQASAVESGLAEAGERRGPFRVAGWGERERPLKARESSGGIEA